MSESEAEHGTARGYLVTWVALVLLTGLTLGLSFVPTGPLRWPIALGIAGAKASLVALFFMHLAGSRGATRFALLIGVLFVALLATLSAADIATR